MNPPLCVSELRAPGPAPSPSQLCGAGGGSGKSWLEGSLGDERELLTLAPGGRDQTSPRSGLVSVLATLGLWASKVFRGFRARNKKCPLVDSDGITCRRGKLLPDPCQSMAGACPET